MDTVKYTLGVNDKELGTFQASSLKDTGGHFDAVLNLLRFHCISSVVWMHWQIVPSHRPTLLSILRRAHQEHSKKEVINRLLDA